MNLQPSIIRLERNPTFCMLPRELFQYILSSYCDDKSLENLWYALSHNERIAKHYWDLLNQVVDQHIAHQPSSQEFRTIADSLLLDLVSHNQNRNRVFRERLNVMKYCQDNLGILWCGFLEFKDPLLPDWSAQTVKVLLRCEKNNWNWAHAVTWNQNFSHTVKLISQMYNFVPVRPRGEIVGVTPQDQAIISQISRQLQARDQVMTMRYGNTNGFILRVISPSQAHQRLARFGSNSITQFETSSDALVCSWESPMQVGENREAVSLEDRLEVISRIVQMF